MWDQSMTPSIFPKTSNTTRAVDLFQISGKKVPRQLIRSYLHVKAACARANFRCGALSKAERDLILRSIAAIRADEPSWEKLFPIDPFQAGAGTTLNMNINEAICLVARRKLKSDILHPNDSVNRSQSTNDTYPTVLRIALLAITPALLGALREIQGAFQRKAKEWATLPKAGRTHLQDAVPMHLGDQMGSYSRTFEKLSSQLSRASDTLREIEYTSRVSSRSTWLSKSGNWARHSPTAPQSFRSPVVDAGCPELCACAGIDRHRASTGLLRPQTSSFGAPHRNP
ncbi:hypothetical protein EBZ37_05920 [bacterium]|nr:hypothetical protein [bacterium]